MPAGGLWERALAAHLKVVPQDEAAGFGKQFERPTFGMDTYALPSWVARAADYNAWALRRAKEHEEYGETESADYWRSKLLRRAPKGIDKIMAKKENLNRHDRSYTPPTQEQKREVFQHRIGGQKGEEYRKALKDPKRPINVMTGERVSPTKWDQRTE